jgi:ligand-binding sensor domain-containing protein
MKRNLGLFAGFLMMVFSTSCNPQNKTELTTNNIKPESKYFLTSDSPKSIVRNIEQDRNGRIWIASWEGIFLSDGKSFTNFTKQVSSARFFSVLEDSKGNMWFGSIGSGVFYYDGKSLPAGQAGFKNYTTKDGLLNNDVVSIYEDKAGNIWFGVFGGASRFDGETFRNFIINDDEMNEDLTGKTFAERGQYEVNSIIEDKTGKLWFATRGNTFVFDGKDFNSVSHLGKQFTNVRSVIEDQKGNIWLGGNDGLWRYDGNVFTNIAKGFVGFIFEDKKGNILTSSETSDGWTLSRYNEKSLSNKIAIVPEVIKANEGMIFGIQEANDGSIWFGTLDGVKRFDGKTVNGFNAMSSQEYFSKMVAKRDDC